MIFGGKINKIPEFYMSFARSAKILHRNNCPNFWGHVPPDPPSPTPMQIIVRFLITSL